MTQNHMRFRNHTVLLLAMVVSMMSAVTPEMAKSLGSLEQQFEFGWSPKMAAHTLNGLKFEYPIDFTLKRLPELEADAISMIDKESANGVFVAAPAGVFNTDALVERVRTALTNVVLPKESKGFVWTAVDPMYVALNRPPEDAHKLSRHDVRQKMYQGYNESVLIVFEYHQLEISERVVIVGDFFVVARGDQAKLLFEAFRQMGGQRPVTESIQTLMACALTIASITGEKPSPVGFRGGVPGNVTGKP